MERYLPELHSIRLIENVLRTALQFSSPARLLDFVLAIPCLNYYLYFVLILPSSNSQSFPSLYCLQSIKLQYNWTNLQCTDPGHSVTRSNTQRMTSVCSSSPPPPAQVTTTKSVERSAPVLTAPLIHCITLQQSTQEAQRLLCTLHAGKQSNQRLHAGPNNGIWSQK